MSTEKTPPQTGKCPECRQPRDPRFRPFCSKRCADIDLGRWLTGSYVIGGGNTDADEDGDLSQDSLSPEAKDVPGSN